MNHDNDMDELTSGYFDESLSDEDMTVLSDWIKDDPANARQFAKASMVHDRLHGEMGSLDENKIVAFPKRRRLLIVAAAAALVLFFGIRQFQPAADTFVTVSRVEGGLDLQAGARRGAGLIQLQKGTIRLLFDNGVEVTLQGPAQFELVEVDSTILTTGLLTANVPPGAEGFRVDTPTAEVVDLGTAFGVHLDEDGVSHVAVFDGEVEVSALGTDKKKRLTEGQEVIINSEHEVESVGIDVSPYEKLWPISTGIKGSSGSFKLAPPWPRRLGLSMSSENILVAANGYRRKLEQPLKVNITTAGKVANRDQLSPGIIPEGSPLRSYVLQYRPEEASPRRFPTRLRGTITFDQPVAGLIVLHEEFKTSSGLFSNRKTGEAHPKRELELNGSSNGDRVELSNDMHTLTVDLAASRKSFDLIRVVVHAKN